MGWVGSGYTKWTHGQLGLSVCDVGVLWQKGWMDHTMPLGVKVGLGPGHNVLAAWGPSSLQRGTASPNFRPACCGQTSGWIKVPLGREVGLGPSDIALDGDNNNNKRE